jgi:hypothetical protein
VLRRLAALGLAGSTLLPALAASAQPADPEPRRGQPLVMREHQVTDPGMQNTVATTLLVPDGWTVEGGMVRPGVQLFYNPVLLDLTVEAPDGRAARFFPSFSFEHNSLEQHPPFTPTRNGNFWHPLPQSVGGWIMGVAEANPAPGITNLQLVEEADLPELTQMLRQQAAPMYQQVQFFNQQFNGFGSQQSFDTQATRVVLRYEDEGVAVEETVVVTWQVIVNTIQNHSRSAHWSISLMRSMRGPVGTDYLNDPALSAIFASARNNPRWDQEMQRYWQELARIRQRGQQQRNRDWAAANRKLSQTLSETTDIVAGGWKSRSASWDRMQDRTVDAIHEQTAYATPGGETVKLPSFYDHVYTDGNGTYILDNDALYNPNTDPAINHRDWQRVEPAR